MARVEAEIEVRGTLEDVEARWYETGRWPEWIDGCSRMLRVDGPWPRVTAEVEWTSGPQGRGRVVEVVSAFEAGAGQTVEVSDASMRGSQSVSFVAGEGTVSVRLELDYRLLSESWLRRLVDRWFVSRTVRDSLKRTLKAFAARGREAL